VVKETKALFMRSMLKTYGTMPVGGIFIL